MGNLNNILDKRMKQLGLKKQIDASMVVLEAQKTIEKIFGERGTQNLKVISYKKGVLKIAAKTSAWSAECQGNVVKLKKDPVERVVFITQFPQEF